MVSPPAGQLRGIPLAVIPPAMRPSPKVKCGRRLQVELEPEIEEEAPHPSLAPCWAEKEKEWRGEIVVRGTGSRSMP